MTVDTYFIFAMGRSGGSSLQHAITAAINKKNPSTGEPFKTGIYHEVLKKSRYPEKTLLKQVEFIKRNFCGLKINLHHFSFIPEEKFGRFDDSKQFFRPIFNSFDHIILNERKNLLKKVISERQAVKLDSWEVNSLEDRVKLIESSKTWTEDLEAVENHLKRKEDLWNFCTDLLSDSEISVYNADYEDVYVDTTVDERIDKVKDIVNWLGYAFDDEHTGTIEHLMSPKRKVSSKRLYSLIDNIHDINERFGPKYGYLFEEHNNDN